MLEDTRSDAPYSLQADEVLAEAYRLGDEPAFDMLYARYIKLLYFYLLKISWFKDEVHLEEILQRVFIVISQGIKTGKFTGGSFRKWAFTVCRMECVKQDENRAAQPLLISGQLLQALPADLTKERPDASAEVEAYQHLTNKINGVLLRLSESERRLFELRKQGYSYERILQEPDFQGWTVGQLRTRYCRIMESLRKYLKKE